MAQQNQKNNQSSPEEIEIDIIASAKTLWLDRKKVFKTVLVFVVIGLIIAIFTEKVYTSQTTFIVQTNNSKIGGNLSGLAAIAGISLGGGMGNDSGISPSLYPQIMSSIPFKKELLQTKLTIEGKAEKVTFEEYYLNIYSPGLFSVLKKYTIGLPGIIIKAIKGTKINNFSNDLNSSQIITISAIEKDLIDALNEQVSLEVNDMEGYVTLSSKMPEAIASAQLTQKAMELLQEYVINFKIQKSKEQLKFIESRYLEKKDWFNLKQQNLASFRDHNQYVNTSLAQTKLETLQSEYDLAFSLYSELTKQWEAQQIQVTEDTPVFTVIKPVMVPMEKLKPKRLSILILWTFFGVIFGIVLVLGNNIFNNYKNNLQNK